MIDFGFLYTRGVRALGSLLLGAAVCAAFADSAAAQYHVATGITWGRGDAGPMIEVGARRAVGDTKRVALGAAAWAGDAGSGFTAVEGRVQFRLGPGAVFEPFVAARGGILRVAGETDPIWGVALGVAPRFSATRRLRVAGSWSRHEGQGGPYAVSIGVEFGGH